MKTIRFRQSLVFLSAMLLCCFCAHANPIELPEKPVTPEISILVGFSILLETVCILLLLWRFRKPRFFVLWLLGMHLLTYPAFLYFLWLFQNIRPAFAAAIGECLVVLIEGILIFLICRYVPAKQNLPAASLIRCWVASLVGNACSLVAFPFLMSFF